MKVEVEVQDYFGNKVIGDAVVALVPRVKRGTEAKAGLIDAKTTQVPQRKHVPHFRECGA